MIRYNFNNTLDFNFDVKSKFVYNFYNTNEKNLDDNVIKNNSINPFSFASLEINYNTRYDERIQQYKENIDSLFSSIFDITDKSLSSDELLVFNKMSDQEKYLNTVQSDILEEEINSINDYHNLSNESEFNSALSFLKTNKKININRSFSKDFKEYNKNNIFVTDSINYNINSFENLFRKEEIDFKNAENIKISENFRSFKTTSTTRYNSGFYYACVGILVEKFKIEENKSVKKDSVFYSSKKLFENVSSNLTVSEFFDIKDNAVQYGSSYFYSIYPVYIMTLPKKEDYFLVETFLVCDYPYITPVIECKEIKRPTCPSNLSFKFFNKLDKMRISWALSQEEQGDVKGYQVFKRESLKEPYTLVRQIEFFNEEDFYDKNLNIPFSVVEKAKTEKTEFYDNNFIKNKIQIYCICAIDARGYTSNYSEQIAVFYNEFDKVTEIDLVSTSGAPLHMPNLLIKRKTRFFNNDDKIVENTPYEKNVSKFTLYATPEMHSMILDSDEDGIITLGDKYKFSIFKLENGKSFVSNINIKNFTKPN
jgi:hypothetical protein